MKTIALALTISFLASSAFGAEVTLEGYSNSNAAILTESLLASSQGNSSISIDQSDYPAIKVTSVDATNSTIECRKLQFGGTPTNYTCTIKTASK
ncbi:hypothetical protein [Bdellovibrio sp. GT3]|uniref:hypothetical protein n=1 Tax=Bdellovibrio sp. GT3 TaxID=3136282 RepID=UPI0030F2D14B